MSASTILPSRSSVGSPENLELLAEEIAVEANHCPNRASQQRLDSLWQRLEEALYGP